MCVGDRLSVMATLSNLSAFKMTSCDAKCNKCRPVPDKCLNKCFVCFSYLKNMTFRAIFAQDKLMGELNSRFTLNNSKKLAKKGNHDLLQNYSTGMCQARQFVYFISFQNTSCFNIFAKLKMC